MSAQSRTSVKNLLAYLTIAIVLGILLLAIWPYQLVASPNSTIHVIDGGKQPVSGLRVIRSWETSEGQKGEEEVATDPKGEVSFKRQVFAMSLLKRLTKPLLIFVPASCGPGWEVYGKSDFKIYWPEGYTLKFDAAAWRLTGEVYQNREGVCIRDPNVIMQNRHESYVDLYAYNKRKDFDYTLTIYRKDKP